MNETRTSSFILQRLPVVLAVTAASYGLNMAQAQVRTSQDAKPRTSAQVQAQAQGPARRPA